MFALALALALAIIPRGWDLKLQVKVETLVGYYLGRATTELPTNEIYYGPLCGVA